MDLVVGLESTASKHGSMRSRRKMAVTWKDSNNPIPRTEEKSKLAFLASPSDATLSIIPVDILQDHVTDTNVGLETPQQKAVLSIIRGAIHLLAG